MPLDVSTITLKNMESLIRLRYCVEKRSGFFGRTLVVSMVVEELKKGVIIFSY